MVIDNRVTKNEKKTESESGKAKKLEVPVYYNMIIAAYYKKTARK